MASLACLERLYQKISTSNYGYDEMGLHVLRLPVISELKGRIKISI